MKISLVIPTYNEEKCIERIIKEIPKKIVHEIIIVDLSTDATAKLAKKLGCKVLRQRGRGFGNAFRQGVEYSSGDVIILMDADGSHNPKDIPKLLDRIKQGYDCVLASRYTIESHSEDDTLLRSFGNWLITIIVNILFRIQTSDSLFLYIAITRNAYNKLNLKSDGFEYCIELLVKAYTLNLKLSEVPSIERKRFAGKSKVNSFKTGYTIITSIIKWRFHLNKLLVKKGNERKKTIE